MTTIINGSSPSITFSDGSAQTSATRPFLNRIINGAMVIDQRNAGASVTPSAGSTYTLDRWQYQADVGSKASIQRNAGSVTPPIGFTNYLGVTSLSAYTAGVNEQYNLSHYIEGFNVADLGWGSANAQTVTLSFWVRSSLTGTFSGALVNSAGNRSYAFTFSVGSANTWTQASITVAGDTSGSWATDNSTGIAVKFNLGSGANKLKTAGSWGTGDVMGATGSVAVVATNGATFYITGVQLEKGSTATSFDYRPYGTELQLCQRYFQKIGGDVDFYAFAMWNVNTNSSSNNIILPNTMRSQPTATVFGTPINTSGGSVGTNKWALYNNSGWRGCVSVNFSILGQTSARLDADSNDALTAGGASGLYGGTSCYFTFSAEL